MRNQSRCLRLLLRNRFKIFDLRSSVSL
jgi:hypothetical protein